MEENNVGKRVLSGESFGTIRYCGPLVHNGKPEGSDM